MTFRARSRWSDIKTFHYRYVRGCSRTRRAVISTTRNSRYVIGGAARKRRIGKRRIGASFSPTRPFPDSPILSPTERKRRVGERAIHPFPHSLRHHHAVACVFTSCRRQCT